MATVDCSEDAVFLASSCLAEAIADIFAELLKQPHVEQDDDFFELGGDSLTAAALMLELEKIGIELPVSVLFDSPTPASLALVAGSTGTLPDHSLVVLKPGVAREPVFIAPGFSGSALEMVPFARKVETERQIYGLQPRDEKGAKVPLATIEDAARFYLPLIRKEQPQGPYILAGYSLGGAVALELAQMLQAVGERVALVVMLDTLTPFQHFSLSGKIHFWARRAVDHGREIRRLPLRQLAPYLLGRASGLIKDLQGRTSGAATSQSLAGADVVQPEKPTAPAFSKYRPRFYPGVVTFIQAEATYEGKPYYPDILWRHLAGKLVIHRVKGDHSTMFSRHSSCVAEILSRCLDTVAGDPG